ncbi:acyl carrier protein [Fibrobacterota bacterium]
MMDKQVEEVIRTTFNLDSQIIDENWTSENLPQWDSMGHLNLMMALEKKFNIKFEIEEMFQIQSLKDASNIIESKLHP